MYEGEKTSALVLLLLLLLFVCLFVCLWFLFGWLVGWGFFGWVGLFVFVLVWFGFQTSESI